MEPDRPEIEGISRRRMLKRIGAGAAIAWSAPVLTSFRAPAFAVSPVCQGCGGVQRKDLGGSARLMAALAPAAPGCVCHRVALAQQ